MKHSIRSQIIARLLANLAPLKDQGVLRALERTRDLFVNSDIRPALQLYAGPERLSARDTRGRTWHFDIALKLLVDDARDVTKPIDDLVPQIQTLIENDLQLGGLADIVDGGEEIPFLAEAAKPLGGSLITYTIQYRRVLGDPYTTY